MSHDLSHDLAYSPLNTLFDECVYFFEGVLRGNVEDFYLPFSPFSEKDKYFTYILQLVLEIMVSIQTLSDYFGILSDPKRFGSDIRLSTT